MKTKQEQLNEFYKEKIKHLKKEIRVKMIDYVAKNRGLIITRCIMIEDEVNTILKKFFCSDEVRQTEILHLLFSSEGFSLSRKKELIYYIITNYYKEAFEKHISLKKFKKIFDSVVETRNHCAHRSFNPDHEDNDQYVHLHELKTQEHKIKSVKIPFDEDTAIKRGTDIIVVTAAVFLLQKLMEAKPL